MLVLRNLLRTIVSNRDHCTLKFGKLMSHKYWSYRITSRRLQEVASIARRESKGRLETTGFRQYGTLTDHDFESSDDSITSHCHAKYLSMLKNLILILTIESWTYTIVNIT